jgi:acetolactate synthase-1/2/3 large subunit
MVKPQFAIESVRDLAASRDEPVLWTTGVGQHQMWAMQYLQCDEPRSFITSGGLGTMGYGIPAAIGAKAARPDATVVCIDGDGCFQMTSQELATATLERLPIVVVLVNNGWLGMVRQWQELFYRAFPRDTSRARYPTTLLAEATAAPVSRRATGFSSRRSSGIRLRPHCAVSTCTATPRRSCRWKARRRRVRRRDQGSRKAVA